MLETPTPITPAVKKSIIEKELPPKPTPDSPVENAERAPVDGAEAPEFPLVFDTPEKRALIKRRARDLVNTIVEEDYNVLVFLDRSARPVYWILHEAWKAMGVQRPFPTTRFLNIGREKLNMTGGWDRPQIDEDEEAFWQKFKSADYIKEMKKKVADKPIHTDWLGRDSRGKVLLIDDVSVSGMTLGLADNFLSHHLPRAQVVKSKFFREEDEAIFHIDGRNGVNTPWNVDKSLTLMAADDPDRVAEVTAQTEKDKQKRAKGLAFKQEIKNLFYEN